MVNMSLRELRKECNKVRTAGGAKKLKSLIPGKAGQARSCLIAVNLNFRCKVSCLPLTPEGNDQKWIVTLNDKEKMQELSNKLGWPIVDHYTKPYSIKAAGSSTFKSSRTYLGKALLLPERLGEVASAFDDHRMPSHLYAH